MSGGGKDKASSYSEAPDSLRSIEIARITDLVSEGEIIGLADKEKPLTCVFFNETPLANPDGSLNFKNIHVDSRVGTQDQDPYTDDLGVESEVPINVELRSDAAWVRSLSNVSLTSLRVRLSVPSILKTDTDNNKTTGYSIAFTIELSVDGGAFYQVVSSAITGKKTSAYSRSYLLELPPATTGWQIRITRLTPNANVGTIQDTMMVASTTEIVAGKYRMPMSATVRTKFDAENVGSIPARAFYMLGRIIRVPSNYNAATRTYTGLWDGTFQLAFTNNPAWMFYDLATNPRYGLGHLADSNAFDKWALYGIARYCDQDVPDGKGGVEPRFSASLYLQQADDATRVMQNMATMFRGIAYVAANVIVPVADMPKDIDYIYTPANVVGGVFNYSGSSGKVRHTVALVSWNDTGDFSRAKVEYVEDEDGVARYGYQETSIIAVGCTSQGQARRMGKHVLLTERLETDVVAFQVGLDGTLVAPGHICAIADPLRAGKRMGGRIRAAGASHIVVDAIPAEVAAGHTVMTVRPDGTVQKNTIQSVVGNAITMTAPFDAPPTPQSMWLGEMPSLNAATYRVLSITESEDGNGYSVTALQHVVDKFDAVELGLKISEPPIAQLPAKFLAAPATVVVSDQDIPEQNTTTKIVTIEAAIVPEATSYHFMWKLDNAGWVDAGTIAEASIDINGVGFGVFVARVTASNSMAKSAPTFSAPYNILPNGMPPKYVEDLTTNIAQNAQDLLDETVARGEALVLEAQSRIDGDIAALNAAAQALLDANAHADTAVLSERNERIGADSAEVNDRLLLAAQIRGGYTGNDLTAVTTGLFAQERTARANQYESLVEQITLMSAGINEQFDAAKMWYFANDVEGWTSSDPIGYAASWITPPHNGDAYLLSPRGLDINAGEFNQLRIRMRRIGTPTWAGQVELYATAGAGIVYSAAPIEPEWDADGIGIITLTMGYSGNIDGFKLLFDATTDTGNRYDVDWAAIGRPAPGASTSALSAEATARANAVSAEATNRQTLSTKITGVADPTSATLATLASGLLYDERQARTTADSSEISARQVLAVSLVGVHDMAGLSLATLSAGMLYDERTARTTGDATEASARQSLSAKITGFADPTGKVLADLSAGLIAEEKSARVTATNAEVVARQALSAKLTGVTDPSSLTLGTLTSGLIYDERIARAYATAVTASQIDGINVTLGNKANVSVTNALNARITDVEGVIDSFAEWDLTFDVNNYISGLNFTSTGTSSTFKVRADSFEVVSPGGADALTWNAGVLSATKGAQALRLGAGFGSDATDKMVFWYGASGTAATGATLGNCSVGITSSGKTKLGGTQMNQGSGWTSGAVISYSATSTLATIGVAAGTFNYGGETLSYSSSSTTVAGSASTSKLVYLYYQDPARTGGAKTLYASTDYRVQFENPDNVFIGTRTITYPAGGGGTYTPPDTPPACVSVNAYVIAASGIKRAGEIVVGDHLMLDDDSWGKVSYSEPSLEFGGRMVTNRGRSLTCSLTAPIKAADGVVTPLDMHGRTPMLRGFPTADYDDIVMDVVRLGEIQVQHITIGDNPNKHFLASDDELGPFFSHHNIKRDIP